MSVTLTPDLCVIGGGAAGLSIAAGASRLGVPVVLVERGTMGGECLNTGCVPSKTLLATASAAQAMRTAAALALPAADPHVDWQAVRARIRATIAAIAPMDSAERYRAMGVTVIEASARFTDRQTLTAGDTIVQARRFVIATGAAPSVPGIPGLETIRWLSSDTIFDVDVLPSHLLILGGGPVGLELAQGFRRLGSAVTVIEPTRPLAREDGEMTRAVFDALTHEGVDIRCGTRAVAIEPGEKGRVRLKIETDTSSEWLFGSHLLVATGRAPRVENLGLDRADVAFDKHGIKVRGDLRTTNRRIFAIGDVIDGPRFTHVGNHQASLVLRKALFRLPVRFVASAMPRVIYTQPELAAVGLDEDAARKVSRRIRILRTPFSDVDRARTDATTTGHIKVITSRRGKVLGASIVGEHAGELLTPWTLAVAGRLSIRDIAQMVVPYPTLSEVSRNAAIGFYTETFDRPIVRRILRWLRKLG